MVKATQAMAVLNKKAKNRGYQEERGQNNYRTLAGPEERTTISSIHEKCI